MENKNIPISACVIVKNEENEIAQWIEKMKLCSDEQIIVDTGSTDRTIEIVKSYGVKIYNYIWQNNFADAKNFALKQAKGKWILFLDADEKFSDKSIKNIRTVIEKIEYGKVFFDAIMCPIINIDVDKNNMELGRFLNVRLFRNSTDLRYIGKIHEELQHKTRRLRIFVEKNLLQIYHIGYSTKRVQSKIERNLKLLQIDIDENGENEKHYRYLSDCYHALGKHELAIRYAKLHLKSNSISIGVESDVYRNIINSMIFLKMSPTFYITEAMQRFPEIPDFYAYYGADFFRKKDFLNAKKYFLKSLKIYNSVPLDGQTATSFMFILGEIYSYLSDIFQKENNLEMSRYYIDLALKENRYNTQAFFQLYYLYEKKENMLQVAIAKYYSESKEDILFIIRQLNDLKISLLYTYYVDLLEKKYEVSTLRMKIYKAIYIKNEKSFFDLVTNNCRKEINRAICIAIDLNDSKKIKELKKYTPEIFLHFLNYWQCDGGSLKKISLSVYIEILWSAIIYGRKSLIEKIILMAKDFSEESIKQILQNLYQQQYWCEASKLLLFKAETFFNTEDKDFLYQSIKCLQYCNEKKISQIFTLNLREHSSYEGYEEDFNSKNKYLEYCMDSLIRNRYQKDMLLNLYKIIRYEDPVELLQIFQAIYNDSKHDISFIVEVLHRYRFDKVYLYYVNILKNKYDLDKGDFFIEGLVAANKIDIAYDELVKNIKEMYILFIAGQLFWGYNKGGFDIEKYLPDQYNKVYKSYFIKEKLDFSEDENSIFRQIDDELNKWR